MAEVRELLLFNPKFLQFLGGFHGAWSTIDQTVDYAIGEFLGITNEQTHLLTSGMMFGRKAQLLAGLIARSQHPKKSELLKNLNKIRGDVRRDWLAHAYVTSDENGVTFIYRNNSGEYKVNSLKFTLPEFVKYTQDMSLYGTDFEKALGVTKDKMDVFIAAAFKAMNKETTSPA